MLRKQRTCERSCHLLCAESVSRTFFCSCDIVNIRRSCQRKIIQKRNVTFAGAFLLFAVVGFLTFIVFRQQIPFDKYQKREDSAIAIACDQRIPLCFETIMPCKQCSLPIDGESDTFTVCRGRCSQPFHIHCAGITADTIRELRCPNVIFLCNDCLVEFGSVRYRKVNEHEEQALQLMNDVMEVKAQVAEILGLLADGKPKQPIGSESFRKHSTPLSNTSSNSPSILAQNDGAPSRNERNEYSTIGNSHSFSLMLSNINNRVTDEEISLLVSHSLGTTELDHVRVTKLVPRWKDCEELDYVSFKVVLDRKWRNAALNRSTWPKEVRYREFVDRRLVPWSPTV